MAEVTAIYVLRDPHTFEPRYVGKSSTPKLRLTQHLLAARTKSVSHLQRWITKLEREGLKPVMDVMEWVPLSEWQNAERYYIREFTKLGARLTNSTPGGDAPPSGPQGKLHYLKRSIMMIYRSFVKDGQLGAAARVAVKMRYMHRLHPSIAPRSWKYIGLDLKRTSLHG